MFLIFGNPVSHSKSPLMHNYFFKKSNIKECYGRYKLENGEEIIDKFKELKIKGANVTVPHKEHAFKLADEVRGIAKEIGAVNTLVEENGKVIGYNTDAPGFLEAVKEFEYESVLIIGAGGTAKALSLVFPNAHILNRSEGRLQYFRNKGLKSFTWDEFKTNSYDLIINTTSAGLSDDNYPAPQNILKELFSKAKYAVDVIYGKETPFLKLAKQYNLKTKTGLDMLVYQGVLAMELFLGKELDKKKTAEIYFEILR
ncbi:shikimate 5-dehydrogenase [Nautilia profundicola AmH]|uniref:shikimate dehydrogenase (NADP(+)) n=1 Tax=Nautilia profundicola (strain ATCC BAA-1463 / DSM 18972 / AmH) TaxID=598659 RepID=B9L9J8_NAUPA|nr:shikimate dehydrogenase [Nautilia profundicola]ACM93691.1 shikimate 5-dehydrogenase [Nautilia profundicola AmH]